MLQIQQIVGWKQPKQIDTGTVRAAMICYWQAFNLDDAEN